MKLAPSILSADFTRLGEQLAECEAAGADWIHVDVMDGQFVPNITMGPVIVEAARRATTLPLDVHLMIVEPERYLADFARAGADVLTVHAEACPNLPETVSQIKDLNCRVGVALKPATDAGVVTPLLNEVDLVLAMTVEPGFSGQAFMVQMLPKVTALRAALDATGREIELEVDGGIDKATAPQALQAGATVFVAASAVFKSGRPITEAIHSLYRKLSPKAL